MAPAPQAARSARPGRAIQRPGRRSQRTRRELVDAARALLAEGGVEGLTVKAVTDRAGLGHGTFYHHYPSTEALLADAIEASLRDLSEEMQKGFAEADDKVWVFVASFSRMLRMMASHPALPWMLERPHEVAQAIREACGPFAMRDVQAMVEAGDVSPKAPVFGARYWEWMVVGALADVASGRHAVDQVEKNLLQFLLFALGIAEERARGPLQRLARSRNRGGRP